MGAGAEGRGVEEREPLRKECLFTIFSLASTWALIRGGGRQRRECHNSYGLRPVVEWSIGHQL